MGTNDFAVAQKLVANRHLKEWKDRAIAEQQALYRLQNQHQLKRNPLRFDHLLEQTVGAALTKNASFKRC